MKTLIVNELQVDPKALHSSLRFSGQPISAQGIVENIVSVLGLTASASTNQSVAQS